MIGLRKILPSSVKRTIRTVASGIAGGMETLPAIIRWMVLDDETKKFRRRVAQNKPYFGPVMHSKQNSSQVKAYMQGIVELECPAEGDYRLLEIGSWAGGSAITWANAIKKFNSGKGLVICVDPYIPYKGDWTGHPAYEIADRALKSGEILDLFFHNIKASGHEDIIKLVRARSEEILPLLGSNQFDLVYIDGNHAYKQVLRDITNAIPLVREGGILCGDDLELQLSVVDVENARRNSEADFILDPKTNQKFHPGVTLAVAECFGEVSAWDKFWVMRKVGRTWQRVVSRTLALGETLASRNI